jgi:hypothetical protein
MSPQITKFIIITLTIIFGVGYFIENRKYSSLIKHLKFVNSSIIFVGKGVKESELTIRYKFDVIGTRYIEQNGYGVYEIDKKCLEGKIFQVAYDSTDPSNSQILITRDDYNKLKIPYPDSFPCVFHF